MCSLLPTENAKTTCTPTSSTSSAASALTTSTQVVPVQVSLKYDLTIDIILPFKKLHIGVDYLG